MADLAEPPSPAAKESHGEKFNREMEKQTGARLPYNAATQNAPKDEQKAPADEAKETAEKTTDKISDKSAAKPSALDFALGEKSPAKADTKAADSTEWEKEDVLKEYPGDAQKRNWHGLRQVAGTQSIELRSLRSEVEKSKAEIAEAKKSGANPAELQQLRTELESAKTVLSQRESDIKAINAEYSDEFRGLVKNKEDAVAKAVNRFKTYGGSPEALAEVLSLPEGRLKTAQLKELMAEMEPEEKTRVLTVIEAVNDADDKMAEFKKDLPKKWDEIQSRQESVRREEAARNITALEENFAKVAKLLPANAPLLNQIDPEIDGAADWNGAVQKAFENGNRIMKGADGVTFEESVAVAVKGSDYDRVANLLIEKDRELKAANLRLAEFDRGGPDFKGGKEAAGSKENRTPGQKYRDSMRAQEAANEND